MKKFSTIILVIVVIIIFFYPKQKYFGCGAVCTQENSQKIDKEQANTICIGIKYVPKDIVMDADVMGCYGIFLKK